MYVLVQGNVPKYNSAQCLLFYISCLIQLIVILFLPIISIVNVNTLIHIYMLSYNYAAVYIQLIYKQYYTLQFSLMHHLPMFSQHLHCIFYYCNSL